MENPHAENYQKPGGHYDTLVVRTSTGRYHRYFNGPDSALRYELNLRANLRALWTRKAVQAETLAAE